KFRTLNSSSLPIELISLPDPYIPDYFKEFNKVDNIALSHIESYLKNLNEQHKITNNNLWDMKKYLILYSIIAMFKKQNKQVSIEEWDFIRVILLHLHLLSELPLNLRAQILPNNKNNNEYDTHYI